MPRLVVAALTALVTVFVLVGLVAVGRFVGGSVDVGLSRTLRSCETDPTASAFQGYCLERWARPELIVVPGRREVRVYAIVDGAHSGERYLVNDDPFSDQTQASDLDVRWSPSGGVRVTDGVASLSYDASTLASLAD